MIRALLSVLLLGAAVQAAAEAVPVEIVKRGGDWVLLRGGAPYEIRGAGIDGTDFESFAARGGNSLRTWAADIPGRSAQEVLDNAHALGLTVSLCLNIARERHGFDYDDPEAVARQFEDARDTVLRYKDHPALLTWIIGNELNFDYENPAVYDAVNDIAEMIHELDGNHPATSTTAGIYAPLLEDIRTRAPALDLLAVQLYGDVVNLPNYMREFDYDGPYFVTEWGAVGHWEMPSTPWGAPIEQTSSDKARTYQRAWDRVMARNGDQIIGNYVFLWGQKQERTPTWYGLFTDRGEATESVDVMTRIWTGEWPENRAPQVISMSLDRRPSGANLMLTQGRSYPARMRVRDPDRDELTWRWSVKAESRSRAEGGDQEAIPPDLPGYIEDRGDGRIVLSATMPKGAYRLFAYASDGNGNAAHANIPFFVR
jgi:beta-galactosidase/beta-glucuronidase